MATRRRQMLGFGLLALPLLVAGCGSSDFPNKPRVPAPIEVTARVNSRQVTIAPDQFGAGLVNLTISNQSSNVVSLNVHGGQLDSTSDPIDPNSVGILKLNFAQGNYDVSAGKDSSARPTQVVVGPPRASSQNQLLLP